MKILWVEDFGTGEIEYTPDEFAKNAFKDFYPLAKSTVDLKEAIRNFEKEFDRELKTTELMNEYSKLFLKNTKIHSLHICLGYSDFMKLNDKHKWDYDIAHIPLVVE